MSKWIVRFEVECAPTIGEVPFLPAAVRARMSGTDVTAIGGDDRQAIALLVRLAFQGAYEEYVPDMLEAADMEQIELITD